MGTHYVSLLLSLLYIIDTLYKLVGDFTFSFLFSCLFFARPCMDILLYIYIYNLIVINTFHLDKISFLKHFSIFHRLYELFLVRLLYFFKKTLSRSVLFFVFSNKPPLSSNKPLKIIGTFCTNF